MEDGFVVVSEPTSSPFSESGADAGTPLSYQDVANVFFGSITQAVREAEARMEAKMEAVVASAVAKVRSDLEAQIVDLQESNTQLASHLAATQNEALQSVLTCEDLERKLKNKTTALLDAAQDSDATTRALREEDKAIISQISALDTSMAEQLKSLSEEQECTKQTLEDLKWTMDNRGKALDEVTCDIDTVHGKVLDLEKRFNSLTAAPKTETCEGRLLLLEQRTNEQQGKIDRLSSQQKGEKSRTDSMFVKISAVSLVLRGGHLPTEDTKTLLKISAWLDSFKLRTTDSRLRDRADKYIGEIEKKTVESV